MLLPVVLAVAIVGALAFTMARDGSMGVAAVEADYEIAKVRYLAEAGLTLAKWQNEQEGCGHRDRHPGAIALPGGSVRIDAVTKADHGVNASVTATLAPRHAGATPASLKLTRAYQLHNLGSKTEITLGDGRKSNDTFIQRDTVYAFDTRSYVELSEGKSHGLVRIELEKIPKNIIVTKAELRLSFDSSGQRAAPRALDLYRATQNWDPKTVNWTSPWPDGGAALEPVVATAEIKGSGTHGWRIDALAEAWANDTLPQHGLLLKPRGLTGVRFASFEGSSSPELFLRYYPRCPR